MSDNERTGPHKESPSEVPATARQEKTKINDTPSVPDVAGMSVLQAALAYAEAGLYVGPLEHRSKHPGSILGISWPTLTSRNPEVIREWYSEHPKGGVFLHCGRSGLVVFDVDRPENLHPLLTFAVDECLPPWQNTRPSRPDRRHYLFAMPEGRMLGNGTGGLGKGWGEVRGRNGVIVVAPSVHEEPDGGYTWGHVGPVPELPEYLAEQLPDAMDAAEAASDAEVDAFVAEHDSGDRTELLDRLLEGWLGKVEAGESRHHTMSGHLTGAMKEAAAGLYPAGEAVRALGDAFSGAVTVEGHGSHQGAARSPEKAADEWAGLLSWAVAQAKAADPDATRARAEEYGKGDPADDFAEPLVDAVPRRSDGEDWLVNMVLPARSYGVLDGPIGAGKSSILGHIVHRVTGKGFRVRYCVEDEPLPTARHRLELLGTDMSLVELHEVPDLTTREAMAQYAASCRSAGVDLVVFDLLASANSAYEENRPEKVKTWTKQLVEQFCTRRGISVLGTHHWNNNSKAGSALARQSGGGALSAKAEFHWSVAMSNDRTEQVWTVHARRKIPVQQNRWMKGTPHFVAVLEDEYEPGAQQELNVYTVDYAGNAGPRTAKDVADEAAREYAEGRKRSSRDLVADLGDALVRFLTGQVRRRPEVDHFLYCLSGERYSPQTVVDRLRDVGATQCDDQGQPKERGKFWTVEG